MRPTSATAASTMPEGSGTMRKLSTKPDWGLFNAIVPPVISTTMVRSSPALTPSSGMTNVVGLANILLGRFTMAVFRSMLLLGPPLEENVATKELAVKFNSRAASKYRK